MSNKNMLINTVEGHECRIAIMEDDRLEELYTERASSASKVGSIYKGRINNIEPSIQAAFVDFGGDKNGFLHISDLHPQFFPKRSKKDTEQVGRRTAHRTRPPIQECLKRGQEVVVQMTKEGIGTKGPTLTTYLSIPGRLLVMMPGMTHVGISRKIEDDEVRGKLKQTLHQLNIPKDMGVIIRTAGVDRSKRDLQRDLSYLTRLWKRVQQDIDSAKAPAEIYQESDLVIRTIRDVFDSDVKRIACDSKSDVFKVKEFLDVAVPRAKCRIEYYQGSQGLFDEFGVEEEIRKVHSHRVEMKKGGSLVIDQTEALVAIDVNSGSFRDHSNAEINALNLNLDAADEIGRQLRLRDLGGVIIIDFVDLRNDKHRRQLERKVRDVLKKDRAKSKVLRLSSFGILEMTRQRLRPSFKQSVYNRCPHCSGTGLIMSQESVALEVIRELNTACAHGDVASIRVEVAPSVQHHLANEQRQMIADLEQRSGKSIIIVANATLTDSDVNIHCKNNRGADVSLEKTPRHGGQDNQPTFVEIDKLGDPARKDTSDEESNDEDDSSKKKRRRGRRGGRKHKKSDSSKSDKDQKDHDTPKEDSGKDQGRSDKKIDDNEDGARDDQSKQEKGGDDRKGDDGSSKKKRRRGRRGGRKHKKKDGSSKGDSGSDGKQQNDGKGQSGGGSDN